MALPEGMLPFSPIYYCLKSGDTEQPTQWQYLWACPEMEGL